MPLPTIYETDTQMNKMGLGSQEQQQIKILHKKARASYTDPTAPERFLVPDDKVNWTKHFPGYKPVEFTTSKITGLSTKPESYADVSNPSSIETFNMFDEHKKITRMSSEVETYKLDESGRPLNPCGRTGMTGRGRLGRWGPNKAADPIVTRWKRDDDSNILCDIYGKKVLQFVLIKRKDNGEWALPGGMVESGGSVSTTLRKEFGEEALCSLEMSKDDAEKLKQLIETSFENGIEIYKGYVDDPRNTDNAWMETTAVNFHDEDGTLFSLFNLHAGDDAGEAKWVTYSWDTDLYDNFEMYANHKELLEKVLDLHKAS